MNALGEEEDISLTVAIYRHKDSRRYAARGSISSASSHRLTRGTAHFNVPGRSRAMALQRVIA